jgi:dipeptide/tripeptide permease
MGYFEVARERYGDEAAEGPPAVLRIMLVFSMVSVFWALFDQHSSTWIEQARQMDLVVNVPFWLGGYLACTTLVIAVYGGIWLILWVSNLTIPPALNRAFLALVALAGVACGVLQLTTGRSYRLSLLANQLAALNPLMVMLTIPLLNALVWRPLERRNIELRPLQRMTIGMFLAAAAFVAAGVLQSAVQGSAEKIPVLWQVGQYLLITTAEVLVSATGLEFAYTQAPRAMKSTIMGFWMLCITIGDLLVAFLSPLQKAFPLSVFFYVFAGLMAAASLAFAWLASRYRGQTFLQHQAAK